MNNRNVASIDISNSPELLRIVEEVKTSRKPHLLKKDSKNVALVLPIGTPTSAKKKRTKTKADDEAFRASAGSWKDVDIEQFKKAIYESRKLSTRPLVEL